MIRNALVLFCYLVFTCCAPAYGRTAMKFLNSLVFTGMPDLGQYGFMSNHVIYGNVWNGVAVVADANGNNLPNEAGTRQIIRSIIASGYRGLVQWDIEGIGWDWDPRWHPNTHQQGIANFQKILEWSKDEAKGLLRIGNYYFPPDSDYRGNSAAQLADLRAADDALAPLTALVDDFYPQAYTFDNDTSFWVDSIATKVAECRRIAPGKPIYPYIWPQYHPMIGRPLAGTYVPGEFWLLQLATLKALKVDGVVFWGGYKTPWDPNQGWWRETLKFLAM